MWAPLLFSGDLLLFCCRCALNQTMCVCAGAQMRAATWRLRIGCAKLCQAMRANTATRPAIYLSQAGLRTLPSPRLFRPPSLPPPKPPALLHTFPCTRSLQPKVPLDVCAYACQLLGASLFVASRMASPDRWAALASLVPEEGVDGLLECLRVVPARAKAARALFYAAKAPLAGGTGGELVESRGGVTVRRVRCLPAAAALSQKIRPDQRYHVFSRPNRKVNK